MRLCDPHQYTVTGFANDFPLSSAPPPYSEHPTDRQRIPTRAHYLSLGIDPPPPDYTTAIACTTTNNNQSNSVNHEDDRRRRRPRRPPPRYPPQPFALPWDSCADTVLRAMTRQAEDELDRLEREADGRVADFCARKRRAAAAVPADTGADGDEDGGPSRPDRQEQAERERPVGGVVLGRVEFEKGVAEAIAAFREGKKQVYEGLAHRYGRHMADLVWEALEANELLPSEYTKILAQNPAGSEVICLWDPDEEDDNAEEEEQNMLDLNNFAGLFAHQSEDQLLNNIWIGLLGVEALMVLGVALRGLLGAVASSRLARRRQSRESDFFRPGCSQ
ncbi:hypothetical protein VTH06DRAFT_7178 [Thermothelomyces fergusii]